MRLVRPTVLVDLNRRRARRDRARTAPCGSARRCARRRSSAIARAHPARSREALPYVGHFVTRNRGTVGGSIAHADGGAELPLCLVALGGTVVVDGPAGRREIAGGRVLRHALPDDARAGRARRRDRLAAAAQGDGFAFEELALRHGDYALSMVAVVLRRVDGVARDVRVGVGAVTDRPTR